MSTPLLDASYRILLDAHPGEQLRFVDSLIQAAEQQGKRFVLPAVYANMKPVLEAYIGKPRGFLQYVKAMRDEAREAQRLDAAAELQEFYRVLEVREAQRTRRDRVRAAVAWLEKECPEAGTEQKRMWVRRLEQKWSKQRAAMLNAWRREHGKRVPEDERRALLEDFWRGVDEAIQQGRLPPLEP